MNRLVTLFLALLLLSGSAALSQESKDTLPRFSVTNIGSNHIIIGWVNNYPLVKQISIQSSHDSLTNYKTILSVADPNARENGYADTKASNDHLFYRLFIVLDKGQFLFTPAKRPSLDTMKVSRVTTIDKSNREPVVIGIKPTSEKKQSFIPSFYIYTNKDGYVFINLPDANEKKYHIKFYEEDNSFLFEIRNIKDTALTIDKTNFMHAGWFSFELYNDDKLVEKNKFYLSKDF
jgi:hypothetical protein